MLNVKVEKINGILVTTSNRVAEELGVNHKDLLKKIDNYVEKFGGETFRHENLSKFQSAKLSADFYISSTFENRGKKYRNYLITKKGIAQLIGGYSSAVERAFELNVAYINKFEEMEKALQNQRLPLNRNFKEIKIYDFKKTYNGIPVMLISDVVKITKINDNTIYYLLKENKTVLKGIELAKFKEENNNCFNGCKALIILSYQDVITILEFFKVYEDFKREIENYFFPDKKVVVHQEPKQEKSKHTLEELELVLKASENLNEKLQRHCVAEHVIEEIMGTKFFDSYYTSKTAIIAKAEIEQMTPAERKMLKKKIETNKMYGLLEPKAKGIVDCVLGKE